MRRVSVLLPVLALVLAGSVALGRPSSDAGAQAASPAVGAAAPMAGVTFELLDSGEPAAAAGQTLVFARVALDAGGYVGVHGHPGAQIWYVAAGTFSNEVLEGTMRVTRAADGGTPAPAERFGPGAEATLAAGDSAFFDADVLHTVRQAGAEPVVVLIPALFETGQPPLIFHHTHD